MVWGQQIMNLTNVMLGYAEVNITPKDPMELIGFNREDNISRGILHRLIAQVTVWKSSSESFCIVTIDNIGSSIQDTNILRDEISQKLGIGKGNVMVCFSHTHSAPNDGKERSYFELVCRKVLEGVDHATKTFSPVKAVWGVVEADIGVNRRNENGEVDRRIGILKIVDANSEELRMILLRVTAHANVLVRDNYMISSDYFGRTRELLGQKYKCGVMITQGASGNVKPKYQKSLEALDKMAHAIEGAVDKVIYKLIPEYIDRINLFSETISFTSEVPTKEKAKAIAEEAMKESNICGTEWLDEVNLLHSQNIKEQITNIEIQYFVLNNGCWCGVSEEVMCEIALDISKKADDKLIYFSGYTNGCSGYLPTSEEFKAGGYEVLWSYLLYYKYHDRVMPLYIDTANKLVEIVCKRWLKINKGYKHNLN